MGKASPSKRRRPQVAPKKAKAPPSLQVGALCYRFSKKGALRVLLITSRDTGRWVIPKGWPMRNRSDPDAAAREAFEEAGVKGDVSPVSIGLYRYIKNGIPCVVRVYPLAVREAVPEYPEAGQRHARWFNPAKAARQVNEPELAALIRGFRPEPGPEPGPGPEVMPQT